MGIRYGWIRTIDNLRVSVNEPFKWQGFRELGLGFSVEEKLFARELGFGAQEKPCARLPAVVLRCSCCAPQSEGTSLAFQQYNKRMRNEGE